VWGHLRAPPYDDSRISVNSDSTPHFIVSNRDLYQLTKAYLPYNFLKQ